MCERGCLDGLWVDVFRFDVGFFALIGCLDGLDVWLMLVVWMLVSLLVCLSLFGMWLFVVCCVIYMRKTLVYF